MRKTIIWAIFLIYMVVLMKVILFKYPMDMIMNILKSSETLPLSVRIQNSNFIPFRTIYNFIFQSQNYRISIKNVLGNIIAFTPLGFLLPIVFNKINNIKIIILSSFFVSIIFELIQLLTGMGDFDVDDIILNVLGAIVGYMVYRVLKNLFYKIN